LLYNHNQGGESILAYGVEKRLSFDPGVLEDGSDVKRKHMPITTGNMNNINSMYTSVGWSDHRETLHHSPCEYDPRRTHKHHQVE
jgi:hypothetical protein